MIALALYLHWSINEVLSTRALLPSQGNCAKSISKKKRPGRACDRVVRSRFRRFTVRFLQEDANRAALAIRPRFPCQLPVVKDHVVLTGVPSREPLNVTV